MGCKLSKVDNSEVVWLCRKRKRMMSDAVKYRQEFATAHLAYIDTLKQVGHALLQYTDRQPSDMEVMPKSFSQTNGQAPSKPSVKPAAKPPTSPSKSPTTTHTKSPLHAASPAEQQGPSHPKSDGTHLSSTRSAPVKHENSENVMSKDASSPTFQSWVQELSGDGFMSSLPSSPTGAASYYASSQPSSPQNSEWDPFNLFSALPFRSPEQTTRQFQDWDAVPQANDFVGVDGMPDLEEDESDQNMELNEPTKVSAEQSLGEVNTMESLGKPEKKQIRANAEKVLEKIDEDSAEEAEASPVHTNAKGKENDSAEEMKDLPRNTIAAVKNISECIKQLNDVFLRASDSGHEVSEMLETQIVYPRSRILDFSDSFRFSNTISRQRSRKSLSRRMDIDESDDDLEHDISGSHSLTLERLYTWEKKLYKEVKVGEQLHVAFSRKSKEFHSLDGKGKDLDLIEECRSDVKSLESQLMVSFRAISSASIRIQQVTNEELYPQLIELLRRLKDMWKAMLECHTAQKAAALEIRSIEKSGHKLAASEAHRNAAVKLGNQLELWQDRLCLWIVSQQNYIDALLAWIRICHMEPEAGVKSGAASPALTRGKTPIYLLARKWHDSLLSLDENTVVDAINKFSGIVHDIQLSELEELAEKRKAEMISTRSRSMDRRNRKGNVRRARTEEQDKNVSDDVQKEDAVLVSLQQHLPGIFEALTTFSSVACREYEKLHTEADPLTKK